MSFDPRSLTDISTEILAFASSDPQVSAGVVPDDLVVGSLERAHVESLSMLIEETEQRVARAISQAISDAAFTALGFPLKGPQAAVSSVVFSRFIPTTSSKTVTANSQFIGPSGLIFASTADGVIPANGLTSPAVPVVCLTPGVVGNVPAGSINRFVSPPAGVDMVTNPARATGGTDTETTDARAERFGAYLSTIQRGSNPSLEFAAIISSTAIIDARSIEPFRLSPVPSGVPFSGLVWLYVDDGSSDLTLDAGLKALVEATVEGYVDSTTGLPVPGYKAAGTVVEVRKVPRVNCYVRASVSLRPGGAARWTEIQAALTAASTAYFDRLRIAEKASYQNLVTYLTTCDPDIAEVDLVIWKEGSPVPTYTAPISASDLLFSDSSIPSTIGSRGVLFSGVSSAITYPEWILA